MPIPQTIPDIIPETPTPQITHTPMKSPTVGGGETETGRSEEIHDQETGGAGTQETNQSIVQAIGQGQEIAIGQETLQDICKDIAQDICQQTPVQCIRHCMEAIGLVQEQAAERVMEFHVRDTSQLLGTIASILEFLPELSQRLDTTVGGLTDQVGMAIYADIGSRKVHHKVAKQK